MENNFFDQNDNTRLNEIKNSNPATQYSNTPVQQDNQQQQTNFSLQNQGYQPYNNNQQQYQSFNQPYNNNQQQYQSYNQPYNNNQQQYQSYNQPHYNNQQQYQSYNQPYNSNQQVHGYADSGVAPFYPTKPASSTTVEERRGIRKIFNGIGGALIAQYALMYGLVIFFVTLFSIYNYGNIYEYREAFDGEVQIMQFWEVVAYTWTPAIASICIFFIYNAITKTKSKELIKFKGFSGKFVLCAAICILCFQQVSTFISMFLMNVFNSIGIEVTSIEYDISPGFWPQAANFFAAVILAPIAEEMLYRGVVLKAASKISQRFAIFFSAFIFGIMHGNPYQMVLGILLGIILGYITIKSGSIVPAIICHMINNLFASLSEIISLYNEEAGNIFYLGLGVLFFIGGLITIIILFVKGKIHFPSYTEYHKRRTFPILFTSLCMYIMMAIYIYDLVTSFGKIA